MKYYVNKDELYPVYYLESPSSYVVEQQVEIPDDLRIKYDKALGNFIKVRDELTDYLYKTKA